MRLDEDELMIRNFSETNDKWAVLNIIMSNPVKYPVSYGTAGKGYNFCICQGINGMVIGKGETILLCIEDLIERLKG